MSTFNGLVDEFPEIRIDHFRTRAGRRPPAACFLSHVHSDHLLGLETLKMPFVYCSAATRSILLRMEKYPHRINFQKGILESRRQTYRHLKSILRSLPLETPIELELKPRFTIRVTLFDANHCPGAVMFLIEGDGKAILYTGDIRAEPWWVNAIVRHPVLLPYTCGHQRLDCIYLDTTFASHEDVYKNFPSKADGLKELLDKVVRCAPGSTFYFRAWTLGYEDVWLALANFLRSHVHVDDYQLGLYASCAETGSSQASPLIGAQVGNSMHPGCLSNDVKAVVHSCEPGMECHTRLKKASNVVWITPIISRSQDGTELAEVGAGGGFGDLHQISTLEHVDEASVQALRMFCRSMFSEDSQLQKIEATLKASFDTGTLNAPLDGLGLNQDDETTLKDFISLIARRKPSTGDGCGTSKDTTVPSQKILHFPYSRHSSLIELRDLVSRFSPSDIYPCTIDVATWTEKVSMESLFGDLCTEKTFKHDVRTREMVTLQRPNLDNHAARHPENRKRKRREYDSQETASQDSQDFNSHEKAADVVNEALVPANLTDKPIAQEDVIVITDNEDDDGEVDDDRNPEDIDIATSTSDISFPSEAFNSQGYQDKKTANVDIPNLERRRATRQNAYRAARACVLDSEFSQWEGLHLRSLGWKGHTEEEFTL